MLRFLGYRDYEVYELSSTEVLVEAVEQKGYHGTCEYWILKMLTHVFTA